MMYNSEMDCSESDSSLNGGGVGVLPVHGDQQNQSKAFKIFRSIVDEEISSEEENNILTDVHSASTDPNQTETNKQREESKNTTVTEASSASFDSVFSSIAVVRQEVKRQERRRRVYLSLAGFIAILSVVGTVAAVVIISVMKVQSNHFVPVIASFLASTLLTSAVWGVLKWKFQRDTTRDSVYLRRNAEYFGSADRNDFIPKQFFQSSQTDDDSDLHYYDTESSERTTTKSDLIDEKHYTDRPSTNNC